MSDAHPSLEDLRSVPALADLSQADLEWLAERMELRSFEDGEVIARQGEPAEQMIIFFAGELRAERSDGRLFIARPGQITGLIPYSRMTQYSSTVRAWGASRAATLHKRHFDDLLSHVPVLHERLVGLLTDRIRDDASSKQQQEKLMALGKLSAGLAHELNNPATAAQRAADALHTALTTMHASSLELEEREAPPDARAFLTRLEADWMGRCCRSVVLDSLERSEQEDELTNWLEEHGISKPWELAGALVDAGCTTVADLEEVAGHVPQALLEPALVRLVSGFTAIRLVGEIQSSVGRISELVRAVKEYSYMDQAPEQTIDLHDGIENTLVMLRHRFKEGVEIARQYDRSIPKLRAHGSELNQVWTNLIGNAIDAMKGKGKLEIATRRDDKHAIVEFIDSGPGIPPEVASRIFEPFFTTKPVGEGTGLGLDVSRRIIGNHSGTLTFESKPGRTAFQVRLPIKE